MTKRKLLYNPFERYTEKQLLSIGGAGLIVGSVLGYLFNGRFDGALDFHLASSAFWMPFGDNLIATFCLAVVFFAAGKIINRKTRFVDALALSLIGRFPIYLLTLTNINHIAEKATQKLMPMLQHPGADIPINALVVSLITGVIGILCLVWAIAYFYNGFKVATHGHGAKLVITFIIALLLAEVLSKFIFSLNPYML